MKIIILSPACYGSLSKHLYNKTKDLIANHPFKDSKKLLIVKVYCKNHAILPYVKNGCLFRIISSIITVIIDRFFGAFIWVQKNKKIHKLTETITFYIHTAYPIPIEHIDFKTTIIWTTHNDCNTKYAESELKTNVSELSEQIRERLASGHGATSIVSDSHSGEWRNIVLLGIILVYLVWLIRTSYIEDIKNLITPHSSLFFYFMLHCVTVFVIPIWFSLVKIVNCEKTEHICLIDNNKLILSTYICFFAGQSLIKTHNYIYLISLLGVTILSHSIGFFRGIDWATRKCLSASIVFVLCFLTAVSLGCVSFLNLNIRNEEIKNELIKNKNLNGIRLDSINFEKTIFSNCSITNSYLINCNFVKTQSSLDTCRLLGSIFENINAQLDESSISYLRFTCVDFTKASFIGSDIRYSQIDSFCNFTNTKFDSTNLKRAIVRGVDFTKALGLECGMFVPDTSELKGVRLPRYLNGNNCQRLQNIGIIH